jgi:pyruvate/2-oxoglutarate dehydrogenase complex dihydrolipoamide dehydrogenase (E3) component
MKVAIIERKLLPGTCVNTGRIPTATMVAIAYAPPTDTQRIGSVRY